MKLRDKLHETAYVKVPVSEIPEIEGRYMVTNGYGLFEASFLKEYGFHDEFTDCSGITHWLKPIPKSYVLTVKEMELLLREAFDKGTLYGRDYELNGVRSLAGNEEDYINFKLFRKK